MRCSRFNAVYRGEARSLLNNGRLNETSIKKKRKEKLGIKSTSVRLIPRSLRESWFPFPRNSFIRSIPARIRTIVYREDLYIPIINSVAN